MSTFLSAGQAAVHSKIMAWQKTSAKRFVLAGYAGAGKTTLAKYIANDIDPDAVLFAAYTGKAANVLREKGCATAGTIHGFLYSLTDHKRKVITDLERAIHEALKSSDTMLVRELSEQLAAKRAEFRKPKFSLNMDSALKDAPLVIVDEYSMLPEKLIADIEKVAKKVLYLGDPFQLPPISGECTLQPDAFIEEIHRQALNSPIIRYSKDVREGKRLAFCNDGEFAYRPRSQTTPELFTSADQIIVGKNKTRTGWNARFRALRGFDHSKLPVKGDKMICLKNNAEAGLFNGMIGTCNGMEGNPRDSHYVLNFEDSYGLNVWSGDVLGRGEEYDGYDDYMKSLDRFDFGYAITCHKSQGSEFDKVVIYNEPIGREEVDRRRWLYTAITRGKKQVTLVEPQ